MEQEPSCPVWRRRCLSRLAFFLLVVLPACAPQQRESALDRVRRTGTIVYGSDAEGGGPYAFPDPKDPRTPTGFEVELIAQIMGDFGPKPRLQQGQWDTLLPLLNTGRIDLVLNGYEWTAPRVERYLASRAYYVYQLQLMAPNGGAVASWEAITQPKPGGGRWRVGVLGGSAADGFARENARQTADVLYFAGATDAMMAVRNGQADVTLQDLPAARFYAGEFPSLALAGPPVGRGTYVMYFRHGDESLRDAFDAGITRLARSGELRRLYEKYGIWTEAQEALRSEVRPATATVAQESGRGWALMQRYGATLLTAAGLTVVLSVASMPLAMGIGLAVALGRLYGPTPVKWGAAVYVEVLRGTPLMLQLFVLFFLLPELDLSLPPLAAGILGLAINYSAYEAEIYRAGLQAIPVGQMEAALALGMSRTTALRRVMVPQAVRIVIPPGDE